MVMIGAWVEYPPSDSTVKSFEYPPMPHNVTLRFIYDLCIYEAYDSSKLCSPHLFAEATDLFFVLIQYKTVFLIFKNQGIRPYPLQRMHAMSVLRCSIKIAKI